ncbi:MAG: ABC transporter permease [Candidatus Latescibacteria bacterium]|nr:ABC transporter permease [Candidatus Latescibacterota bacterium]NIM21435.1 ABC transporter permease [Candidatus Latescibacterota bacterium]NIM65616.1 ABC transporter permease [Candidatus Latescibacterota bacterium]NIO01996.1 ABC transporter permease [Candidatus Latescibacterota bacterium]NIO28808.1 ABC transporter permease [Candidatus Latescibacterota bacterium]
MMRSWETPFWVFFMPIVFFYFIGTVTGGMSSTGSGPAQLTLKTGGNEGFLVDQMVRRLEERDYGVARPETDEAYEKYSRRLEIPEALTDSVLAGKPVTVRFTHKSTGLGNDYDQIRIARAVYTVLADLIVTSEIGTQPAPESFDQLNSMPRAITLEVKPAGKRKHIPSGFEQAIPGIIVMFILLVMTTSGAVLLLIERRQGLLRRLASTPIDRLSVVLGKLGGKMTLGLVQIAFAMLAGTLIFKMNWGPDLGMVILVLLIYAFLMASIGILLGSLARTEAQAVGVGVIASNVLAALGGCWWPIEITPQWMQKLQLFLPTGWAMDALHKLISFAAGPANVIPHVAGMLLAALILAGISTKVFRFQ